MMGPWPWMLACNVFGLAFGLTGCDKARPLAASDGNSPAEMCSIEDAVKYSEQISGMLEQRCTNCHSSELSGDARTLAPVGVDFDNPSAAIRSAEPAGRRIQKGQMPPSGPLDACEAQTFQRWVETGTPR